MKRRSFLVNSLAATGAMAAWSPSTATASETYPSRPIRMVVPFNAGGSVDTVARAMADFLRQRFGQPVIVENKPGATGVIAVQTVLDAAPDGHTLFFATESALVLNPLLSKKLPYDAVRDFAPVAAVLKVPLVLLVNAASPIKTTAELVAHAKQAPGKLNYASTGNGGVSHLVTELFSQKAGIEMTHVRFSGGAPAIQSVASGHVDLLFNVVGSALPYIAGGRLRPLALGTNERLDVLPGVGTLGEAGYDGLDAMASYVLVASRKTPPGVVATLNQAINTLIADKDFRERYTAQGFLMPAPHTPKAFEDELARDRAMWATVIQRGGLSLE